MQSPWEGDRAGAAYGPRSRGRCPPEAVRPSGVGAPALQGYCNPGTPGHAFCALR